MTIRQVTPADGSGAITVIWDTSVLSVPKDTMVDIPAGSTLEAAYGLANLTTVSNTVLASDQQGDDESATDN